LNGRVLGLWARGWEVLPHVITAQAETHCGDLAPRLTSGSDLEDHPLWCDSHESWRVRAGHPQFEYCPNPAQVEGSTSAEICLLSGSLQRVSSPNPMHDFASLSDTSICCIWRVELRRLIALRQTLGRRSMQDTACRLPRIPLPRRWLHSMLRRGLPMTSSTQERRLGTPGRAPLGRARPLLRA
jgi:hypothetical protein